MAELEFRKAIWQALDEELARDENVIFFGEDVAKAGGVFQVTPGLCDRHGEDRVFDTPISELALSTAAFGSAVCGLRPVFEIMFADFFALAMDSLVNQAAKYWYLSNGQAPVPLVVRSAVGGGGRFGAIHSQVPAPWFQAIPGLKIVAPATPAHAKGLLKASIRDNNPVLFFEHKRLYSLSAEVDGSEPELIPLGSAETVREGSDLTIATAMKGVHDSLAAADELAPLGIDCEVIDLRTLRPLDIDAVAASVEKTGRLLVVEEGPRTGGWAGEVVASISERCLGRLDDCWRLATDDLPLPYSPPLEDAFLPGTAAIVRAVRERGGVMPEGAA
jgi:pyruvate/2-oxoglutarate/acetoin dehydrogenase E1 component